MSLPPGHPLDRAGSDRRLPAVAPAVWAVVLGAGLALAPTASAHDGLVGSSPKAGSVLTEAPMTVELEFAGTLVSASVELVDGCGRQVPSTAAVSGAVVSADLAVAGLSDARGSWTLRWVTIGGDGHAVDGALAFTVDGTPDCSASTPDAGASASAGPAHSPEPVATAAATGPEAVQSEAVRARAVQAAPEGPDRDAVDGTATDGTATDGDAVVAAAPVSPTAPLLAGGVVLLAGTWAVVASRLRRSRPKGADA